MVLHIKVSADTMCGVMLCDVTEVFTHPFAECTLGMSDVLFEAHLTSNTINDIIGLATTTPNGVVFATSDRTFNATTFVQFYAVPAVLSRAGCAFVISLEVPHGLDVHGVSY